MAKRGHSHVFDDPSKKAEMLALRKLGYSVTQIALFYGVNHSSILYHFRKLKTHVVSDNLKRKMAKMVESGMTIKEVALKYKMQPASVSAYIAHVGLKGYRILPGDPQKNLVLKILPRWRKPEKKPKVIRKIPRKRVITTRPGWIKGLNGEWICAGKSMKQIKKEREERQKRLESEKRASMLLY